MNKQELRDRCTHVPDDTIQAIVLLTSVTVRPDFADQPRAHSDTQSADSIVVIAIQFHWLTKMKARCGETVFCGFRVGG